MAENGVPPESARAFQAFADEHNVVIKVRPTNTASLQVLAEGGLPKPEIVKVKTLNRTDMLIGGAAGQEGKVGFFEPKMPPKEVMDALNPDAQKQVTDRYNQRLEEYQHYKQEYADLAAEGLIRIEIGVLQVADPRGAATPDAPRGPFKDVGGDHDVFDIRHSDGSQLTDAERTLATAMLRSMGINVEHGYHMAWQQDSPQTYSHEADAKIQQQHTDGEPLVAFVPKSQPREVFADDEVHGPERTPGEMDPFRPLKGAKFVDSPPAHTPGSGENGATHGTPSAVRDARRDAAAHAPDLTALNDVLPTMRESSKFADRQTAWLIDQGAIEVHVFDQVPELPVVERIQRLKDQGRDPADYTIVRFDVDVGGTRVTRELTIRKGASGHEVGIDENGKAHIIISRHMTQEEFMRTLRHEVNHALRPSSPPGSIELYRDEFDAYWMDGSFDEFPKNQRAKKIREAILRNYEDLARAWNGNAAFAQEAAAYRRPRGNILNSIVWNNVEAELTSREPGRELRAIKSLQSASPRERALLRENENFMQLLRENLRESRGILSTAYRVLGVNQPVP
jgi:hypothetical protein